MAVIAGIFIEKSETKLVLGVIGMILGTVFVYLLERLWFVLVMKTSVQAALYNVYLRFIVFDIIKIRSCRRDWAAASDARVRRYMHVPRCC